MWILYCQNTFSFLSTDLFCTHQNHELFEKCLWFFSFFPFEFSIIKNFSLSCKTFCVGDSPNLHCLSVSDFSLSRLLYIVCGTRSFVLGYFLVFLSVQLIFTPATTVAAVQSDIPVVSSSSSSSCQSAATQVSLSSFVSWYSKVWVFRLKINVRLCLSYGWFQCFLSYISD